MPEKQKTAKLEINFQDTYVPVYTSFKNIKKGFAVLYGKHTKKFEVSFLMRDSPGKIMGKDGVEINYTLRPPPGPFDFKKLGDKWVKLCKLSPNSLVWLLGYYISDALEAFDFGIKEDFLYPNLLE